MQFEVYKSGEDTYYIDYYVAVAFGVGELLDTYIIGNRTFVKANGIDIGIIMGISQTTKVPYKPVFFNLTIPAKKEKSEVQFEVYEYEEDYYIDYYVAVAFGIHISEEREKIGNREFVKANKNDIDNIIEISKLTDAIYVPITFKLYKNQTNDKRNIDFEVYKKEDSYLVDYIIGISFGVGNYSKLEKLGNRTFVNITKDELNYIIDYSNKTNTPYIPHIFNAVNTKPVAKLLVYRDNNDELYIASNSADVLGITILCLENIKPNEIHSKITKEELDKIIEDGKNNGIEIEPEYMNLKTNNLVETEQSKESDYVVFEAYKNILDNSLYLEDGICAYCDIGNREETLYIDERRCYEIEENELDTAAEYLNATPVVKYFEKEKPQKTLKFIVCNLNNNLFIEEYIANLFRYQNIGKKLRIEGKIYYQVTEDQINNIVELTSNLKTKLIPLYKDIELKDTVNETEENTPRTR